MDRRAVHVVHLIELVDATDAVVREDQRAALHLQFVRVGVAQHSGGQSDARGALSLRVTTITHSHRRIDAARRHRGDVLQQLRLGHAGVAHQQHVDLSADLHPVVGDIGDTACT